MQATVESEVMRKTLTAVITKEGNGFVSLCPKIDAASQGSSIERAKDNLRKAVELFFEYASNSEIEERLIPESYISAMEVSVG